MNPTDPSSRETRIATWLYTWRWPLTGVLLAFIAAVFTAGVGRVGGLTASLAELHDPSNGSGNAAPLLFDPSMDIWFGDADAAVAAYYEIEDRFVAEDYVMVTFEAQDDPLGAFGREALRTVSRLTERFLTVGGVRHVRSLTSNPWIRWGEIDGGDVIEEGLIISDLVVGGVDALTDDDLVERMIAVLGAERSAARIGEARVRSVLGPDADFADHIGEPRLIGTIVSDDGGTTAIQVQVLRPRLGESELESAFGSDRHARQAGPILHSVMVQRSVVKGIEHFLRAERGLSVPTAAYDRLLEEAEALPRGAERDARMTALRDPSRSMIRIDDRPAVRKWFEYTPVGEGEYVDLSDPMNPVQAPPGFTPDPISPYTFRLGGVPFFERNFEEVGLGDAKYVPLMFVVLIVGLGLVFRSPLGVAAPLGVVFGSIAAMVGVAFASGDLLNNLTMMAPNMLTAVGIADAVHLVAAWSHLRREIDDKRTLMIEVIRRNALPVSLTSLTTAIGFYSLTVSGLQPVRMLGAMAGLGTLFAYVLSMTLVPALLSLVPHRAAAKGRSRFTLFTPERSAQFVRWIVSRRVPILGVAGACFLVAAYGLSQIEIDSDFRRMFPDDNRTMTDFHWIEERMGGVGDLEIVFAGVPRTAPVEFSADDAARLEALRVRQLGSAAYPDEFPLLTPQETADLAALSVRESYWNAGRIGVSAEFLTALDAFERRLREEMADPDNPMSAVSDLLSPLDILRKMHQVQHENDASYYRVPVEDDVPPAARAAELSYDDLTEEWRFTPPQTSSQLMAQYYLQYENGARPGENLATQLSANRTHFRMQGRVRQASSAIHRALFARIEEIARTEFPILGASVDLTADQTDAVANVTVSGKSVLFARTTHLFATGFVQSMLIALGLITLVIGILFRSVRLALVSLIPNVLPILVPISFFGLSGVSLDGPAILVSSVALGVCVDDTVHLFTKFIAAHRAGATAEAALAAAVQRVGGALSITTVLLVIGFGTLLLSDFAPNFQMGALATVMIALAWFADFVLTTAALSYWRPHSPRAGRLAHA